MARPGTDGGVSLTPTPLPGSAIPEAFLLWLGRSTGLSYPASRYDELWRGLAGVAHELGLADAQAAMGWLMTRPYTHAHAELLASHLSVGETWFLRETPTLDLLEQQLLPELIERRRGLDRSIRIWSAGCCSGEEAWTLAILLSRLLPDLSDWRISVVGSDIVPRFLERGRTGYIANGRFAAPPPGCANAGSRPPPAGSSRWRLHCGRWCSLSRSICSTTHFRRWRISPPLTSSCAAMC